MQAGIFKPGYNVQLVASDEYVFMAKTYPNPTDTLTFIPFLENFKRAYGCSIPKHRWPMQGMAVMTTISTVSVMEWNSIKNTITTKLRSTARKRS